MPHSISVETIHCNERERDKIVPCLDPTFNSGNITGMTFLEICRRSREQTEENRTQPSHIFSGGFIPYTYLNLVTIWQYLFFGSWPFRWPSFVVHGISFGLGCCPKTFHLRIRKRKLFWLRSYDFVVPFWTSSCELWYKAQNLEKQETVSVGFIGMCPSGTKPPMSHFDISWKSKRDLYWRTSMAGFYYQVVYTNSLVVPPAPNNVITPICYECSHV